MFFSNFDPYSVVIALLLDVPIRHLAYFFSVLYLGWFGFIYMHVCALCLSAPLCC